MGTTASQLFDVGARVERIIWIDGIVCADVATEDFEEFLEDCETADIHKLIPELPDEFDGSADEALEYMLPARGFLVKAAVPCRSYYPDDESYTSGWGYYYTQWFRVADIESVAPLITAWSEERAKNDREAAK